MRIEDKSYKSYRTYKTREKIGQIGRISRIRHIRQEKKGRKNYKMGSWMAAREKAFFRLMQASQELQGALIFL